MTYLTKNFINDFCNTCTFNGAEREGVTGVTTPGPGFLGALGYFEFKNTILGNTIAASMAGSQSTKDGLRGPRENHSSRAARAHLGSQ